MGAVSDRRATRPARRVMAGLAALVASAIALAGCGQAQPGAPRGIVRLAPPSYRDVRLGDDASRVRGVFGRGRPYDGADGGSNPIGAATPEFSGPIAAGNPGTRAKPISVSLLGAERYFGSSFLLYDGRVYAFLVIDRNAGLGTQLRIGSPLAHASSRFPTLTCQRGITYEDRSPSTSACYGKFAPNLWAWFGGDPIASIEISRYRLDA
jgi:hypothetical protein